MIDRGIGDLEEMIVGVLRWWGCSNVTCYVRFSPCLVGFALFLYRVVLMLPYTARSKTLTKLALDWQDMLKKATNDEAA